MQAMIDGPNKRRKLEAARQHVAKQLREEPTVPADVDDPQVPCKADLPEDAAVELPQEHCDFRGGSWQGSTKAQQTALLGQIHQKDLGAVIALMHPSHGADEKR